MAISYKHIRTQRQWRASTGLTETQFHTLTKLFEQAYEEMFGECIEDRQSLSGEQPRFTTYPDLLFFVLFSIKSGMTYDLLGLSFDLSPSNVHANQLMALSILQSALELGGYMPKRSYQSEKEFMDHWREEAYLMVDGTEQSTQRPKDQEAQKRKYSGKKKTYD